MRITLRALQSLQRCPASLGKATCYLNPALYGAALRHVAFDHRGLGLLSRARRSGSLSASAMDSDVSTAVSKLHQNPVQAAIFVTGGGFQAIAWLMTVPGASRTVLDIRIPYANASLADVLGHVPAQYASQATVAQMAESAYQHAANLAPFGTPLLGVACTCALVTDRVKKGDHKAFVATHDGQSTATYSLKLAKGLRDRGAEDAVASRLLIQAMHLDSDGHSPDLVAPQLQQDSDAARQDPGSEHLEATTSSRADPLEDVLAGRIRSVEYSGENVYVDAPRQGRIYLPGSFNPLHGGHRDMLAAACQKEQRPQDGCFELSVGNPDKGILPKDEVQQRIAQFTEAGIPLVITQAPLYTLKARLFPSSVFVVGYDTAIRLVDPKYYGGTTQMLLQFAELQHNKCRFLVAGRVADDGKTFMQLSDIDIPDELGAMGLFEDIKEELFRNDISSTELRRRSSGES